MRLFTTVAALCLFLAPTVYAADSTELSENDKLSYSFGKIMGDSVKNQKFDPNQDLLIQGLRDALSGTDKPLLSEDDIKQSMLNFRRKKMEAQQKERETQGTENQAAGEAFLAENKQKEGVKTLPSGLQYKIVQAGSGKSPKLEDTVTTHYRGTLIDGTEFDSSYQRGKPATFKVNGVIAGWTQALQMMKEGAKWQLFIPPQLGYGERGAGGKIGPNATLIFDIELISVD